MRPTIFLVEVEKLVVVEKMGKFSQKDSRSVSDLSLYHMQKKDTAKGKRCKWFGEPIHADNGHEFRIRRENEQLSMKSARGDLTKQEDPGAPDSNTNQFVTGSITI